MGDSAAGAVESPAADEAGKESSVAGTGECLDVIDWFFHRALLMSLYFSDKQTEDSPKSSAAAGNVDLISLDVPRQEVEKPVEGSTAVAQEILGCHSALAVSSFLCSSTFVELSSTHS